MPKNSVPKRTTIILDEKDRNYMDRLIAEGREPGIKPFISKMFDVYRNMTVHDWKYPGEYYCGTSRVAFFSQENLSVLLGCVPEKELRRVGKRMGEATSISLKTGLDIDPRQSGNWQEVLKRLRLFGYGDLTSKENMIVVRNPFINSLQVLQGFLEGLLGVQLEAKTTTTPFIFEPSP